MIIALLYFIGIVSFIIGVFKKNHQLINNSWSGGFTTVSEIQSSTLCGRKELTFSFCFLGLTLLFDQYIKGSNWCLFHLTFPFLSQFPLKTINKEENFFSFTLSSKTSDLIHKTLVLFYTLIVPLIVTEGVIRLYFLFTFFILITAIYKDSRTGLIVESIYIIIFPLIISYAPLLLKN